MINLVRPAAIRLSLQDPRIQEYLDRLAAYKEDSTGPEPKPPGSYRHSDILKAFDKHFHAKCYLTEKKFANSWSMDVDHFVPKHERPDLRYEWVNLFPVDHDANMMRPRVTPTGGYLDPCAEEDDVEKELVCYVYPGGHKVEFHALNSNNAKARNTAELLNTLHQGRKGDEDSIQKVKQLRSLIRKKCQKVQDTVCEWLNAERIGDQAEIILKREELKKLLSRKAAFTMIVRSMNVVKRFVPHEFLD